MNGWKRSVSGPDEECIDRRIDRVRELPFIGGTDHFELCIQVRLSVLPYVTHK